MKGGIAQLDCMKGPFIAGVAGDGSVGEAFEGGVEELAEAQAV